MVKKSNLIKYSLVSFPLNPFKIQFSPVLLTNSNAVLYFKFNMIVFTKTKSFQAYLIIIAVLYSMMN